MPKTVSAAFNMMLSQRLTNSEALSSETKSRRNAIRKKLDDSFGLVSFSAIGSFENATDVPYSSDADYLARIEYGSVPSTPSALLQKVRNALQERYPSTSISIRYPAVRCAFASGRETIEVVPARYVRSNGDDVVFEIGDGDGWKETSPKVHVRYVANHHARLSHKLKPLIRLVKAWNYWCSAGISSFYLEMRTTKWMEGEGSVIHAIDVASVLRRLESCELAKLQDPTSLSGYIAPTTPSAKSSALSKVRRAARHAAEARELEGDGDIRGAFAAWKKVFPYRFPDYG